MKDFSRWLNKKNEAVDGAWFHPDAANGQINTQPNIPNLKAYIKSQVQKYPQWDIVYGMHNIGVNASDLKAPPTGFASGTEQPLSWKNLALLKSWGFKNNNDFLTWWNQNGDQIAKEIKPPRQLY